jgi:hypothetical protein
MKKIMTIGKAVAKEFQKWIDSNKPIPDMAVDELAITYSIRFTNSIEADIKVCNGDNGAWIDAVLFDDGNEVAVLEPQYVLLGEYVFNYEGKIYTAVIKEK